MIWAAMIYTMICTACYGAGGEIREWFFCFPEDGQDWIPAKHIEGYGWQKTEKALAGNSTGDDPILLFQPDLALHAARTDLFILEAKVTTGSRASPPFAQFFWLREGETHFSEESSVPMQLQNDGEYHEYTVDLASRPGWEGLIKKIRFDPLNQPGFFELGAIRLKPKGPAYYWSGFSEKYAPQKTGLILLITGFCLIILFKKIIESFFAAKAVHEKTDRLSRLLPTWLLLFFFFMMSLFPFDQYHGGRIPFAGGECLLPTLILLPALLFLFLIRGRWHWLRIMIVGLFLLALLLLSGFWMDDSFEIWRIPVVGLMILFFTVSVWKDREDKLSGFHYALLLFTGTCLISYVMYSNPSSGGYYLLNLYLTAPVLFTLSSEASKGIDKKPWLIKGMILCGGVVALYGLSEFLFGRILFSNYFYYKYAGTYAQFGWIRRIGSTLIHPSVLASYFIGLLPLCGYLFKKAPSRAGRWITGCLFLLFTTAIILSKSRAGWVLAVLVLFMAFGRFRKKHLLHYGLILVVVCVSGYSTFFYSKQYQSQPRMKALPLSDLQAEAIYRGAKKEHVCIEEAGPIRGGFIAQRIAGLKTTGRLLKKHPLLGVGPGHFKVYCERTRPATERAGRLDTPDNMYLMLAAETGLIGFAFFILMMTILLVSVFRKVKRNGDDLPLDRAILAGTAGLLLHMLFYDLLYWYVPASLFWILIGFHQATRSGGFRPAIPGSPCPSPYHHRNPGPAGGPFP